MSFLIVDQGWKRYLALKKKAKDDKEKEVLAKTPKFFSDACTSQKDNESGTLTYVEPESLAQDDEFEILAQYVVCAQQKTEIADNNAMMSLVSLM